MDQPLAIRVKVSPKQISKLRNGYKVRVKPPTMEGEGICMIVSPAKYDAITRTFSRSKGLEIALSPQEIVANQEVAPQMAGKGIFGNRFDKFVGDTIGEDARGGLYSLADKFKPLAKAGLTAGLTAGGTALGLLQPELIPFIAPSVLGLSALGSDYLDRPSYYQGMVKPSNAGGTKAKLADSLAGRVVQDRALQELNAATGSNLGALDRASIEQALANKALAEMNKMAVQKKLNAIAEKEKYVEKYVEPTFGAGLYAGRARGGSIRRCGGAIGINGSMLHSQSPALRSQPFSANFQFQHTLPPEFQKFSKGSGSGLHL
jgi:hypothetical protein